MKMKIDSYYIRYVIKKYGHNVTSLADKMNLTPSQLNYKINTGTFNIQNIIEMLEILNSDMCVPELKFEDIFIKDVN